MSKDGSDDKLSDEEMLKLVDELAQMVEVIAARAERASHNAASVQVEPEPEIELTTESEKALFEIVKAAVYELEEVKQRVSALEDLILLQYRSKDTRSH